MWDSRRSILLSKWCVAAFGLLLAGVLVFSPFVVGWLLAYMRAPKPWYGPCFYISFFTGGPLCFFLLISLFRLLRNMERGEVFCQTNIRYMRRISWACFAGGVIALASGLYWVPWLAVAAAAGFVGLVVRVFKNVLAQAVKLKEENDYTI